MSWGDSNTEEKPRPGIYEDKSSLFPDEKVKEWMKESTESKASNIFCLLYGKDGSGKTGIVLDYLTEEDIKQGKKMVVIDLDGGATPLKESYHKNKTENLIVIDPLVTTETKEGTQIDYQSTFAKIRAIIRYVNNNYKQEKIKAIVFDGLSTALSYAEQQMRIEENVDVIGGVQQRYWLIRNKIFLDTLKQIKSIPIAKFFIGHTNFIIDDFDPMVPGSRKPSSVVDQTNQMMFQKIRCERKEKGDNVAYFATFDKAKHSVKNEGEQIKFCEVNTKTKTFKWDTARIREVLA